MPFKSFKLMDLPAFEGRTKSGAAVPTVGIASARAMYAGPSETVSEARVEAANLFRAGGNSLPFAADARIHRRAVTIRNRMMKDLNE